jgi:type IV secretory pathway VirB3-like protein
MYLDEHAWGFSMFAVPAALFWATLFALNASRPRSALLIVSVPAGLWLSLFALADLAVYYRAVLTVGLPTKLCVMYGLSSEVVSLCTVIDVVTLIWVVFRFFMYLLVTRCYWMVCLCVHALSARSRVQEFRQAQMNEQRRRYMAIKRIVCEELDAERAPPPFSSIDCKLAPYP